MHYGGDRSKKHVQGLMICTSMLALTCLQKAWSLVYDRILGLIKDDPHAAPATALILGQAQDVRRQPGQ